MIDIDRLCADVEACVGKDEYGSPETLNIGKLKDGGHKVMCAGLIYAALLAQGYKTYNGSNTMWRKWLTDKGSISDHKSTNGYPKNVNARSSRQLVKGMLVFKWNSTDVKHDGLGDYQHVGIVTSTNPLRIVHASSETETVSVDTKVGKFCAWGWLKGAPSMQSDADKQDEKEVESMDGTLRVLTALNVRAKKSADSTRLGQLEEGTLIAYSGSLQDKWVQIDYKGKAAYICTGMNGKRYVEAAEDLPPHYDAPVEDDAFDMPEDDEPYVESDTILLTGDTDEKIHQLAMLVTALFARVSDLERKLNLTQGD